MDPKSQRVCPVAEFLQVFVFHVGVPSTIESWFQEAGRAGHDGSECDGEFIPTPAIPFYLFTVQLPFSRP